MEATFDLAPDKSPGPNGFPPFFFQKYWILVGNYVFRAFKAFFHYGHLLKEINHTFLALIPKINNPSCADNFPPISLCSTIYKIVSKVIINRLKNFFGKIIHPLQGTFVLERLMQDNILIALEGFQSFRKKSVVEGWIAIKLNTEKVYDRLEWDYILTSLEKLGFCSQQISWINSCISSPSFSILVNYIPGDRFYPSREIRQGDPLSPNLFILCDELLARQISFARSQKVKLMRVSSGKSSVRIHFLAFVDDTMIFVKATDQSCSMIKQILDEYCSMSGHLVNFDKSAFQCFPIVLASTKAQFADILAMSESSNLIFRLPNH